MKKGKATLHWRLDYAVQFDMNLLTFRQNIL
jgi:hypothetical protein